MSNLDQSVSLIPSYRTKGLSENNSYKFKADKFFHFCLAKIAFTLCSSAVYSDVPVPTFNNQ